MEQKDDLAKFFAKFLTYWCVQVVVPKSSVPWFQLLTVCRLRTDWISVSITVNHNACLGEIYIAIPRQLVDTKKTFGRLYLTVLDFSLLQSCTCDCFITWLGFGLAWPGRRLWKRNMLNHRGVDKMGNSSDRTKWDWCK